ncbi:PREDICTED: uncharacterized protein LOC108568893 [Nicrophorus vespilloides]|uniref:Uncharacterized protein LOC108568893 n=1 Tax=Nicrophorus vespilloides TaxID=110193 RepID=A0ABM1NFY0_NICVS|nr:PREDICTED: uncharacterized protein LOC108568893 [Nicrophorus vespilloides]
MGHRIPYKRFLILEANQFRLRSTTNNNINNIHFKMNKLVICCISLAVASCLGLDSSRDAKLLKYEFQNDGSGPYHFKYEQSDGQYREEEAELVSKEVVVKGSFSFTAQDGKVYTVRYTADKDGFHPEGDHIKVPPYTPWPTNRYIQEHEDEVPQIETRSKLTNIYLPSSEKPPISSTIDPVIFNEDFLRKTNTNVNHLGTSGNIINQDTISNTYIPSTSIPKVQAVTISPLSHIAEGSSPIPKYRKINGDISNQLFEVIQNNHSSGGVFNQRK